MKSAFHTSLTARMRAQWADFAAERRGSTAVEFAMIAAPFFFLIFGLLEVCLLFVMSTVLEHAVAEASRPLRTGQAQTAGMTQEDFRLVVCSELFDLLNCAANLHIDVRVLNDFGAMPTGAPLDADGNFTEAGFGFAPGGANEIVTVRAFYEWELITPGISFPLKNMAGNKHLLQTSSVFRNEPFE